MPLDYSGLGQPTQKEAFNQSNAAQILGITDQLGNGVCQVCSMWWLEHMKAGGKDDDKSYVFNANAPQVKSALIDGRGDGGTWADILDAKLTLLGFNPAGHTKKAMYEGGEADSDSVDAIATILKASSPDYHLIILGAPGGTNHVCGMHNDGEYFHLFDPNAGHYKTTKQQFRIIQTRKC